MLTSLHVKNLALIDEAEVTLSEGLNILTGETGAGKSIIIGSINYCLGEKVSSDVIREGAEYALVELVFTVDEELKEKLTSMDYQVEDDGTVIISRKIYPGRSVLKISGETVTAKQVKTLASYLIDIHGQHEHQSLISAKNQAEILDDYCGEELDKVKKILSEKYDEYKSVIEKIESLSIDDGLRSREMSLMEFEIEEIEKAAITEEERVSLEARYKKMNGSQKIASALQSAMNSLKRDNTNASDLVGYAVSELSKVSDYDDEIKEIYNNLVNAEELIADVSRNADSYMESLEYSEQEFAEVEARLDTVNTIIHKYGGSVEKVEEHLISQKEKLEELNDIEGNLKRLTAKKDTLEEFIFDMCGKAHMIRENVAKKLSEEIESVLKELNFLKVAFKITLTRKDSFTKEGYDEVSFDISLNPGEKLLPVSKVASGGELSRIMLALKTVFARKDKIGTLIFDEIDAGISGQTAWKVSGRMNDIAGHHQVIAITHLPQIAAMADSHYKIEKSEIEGKTVTNISPLDNEGRIGELARLLGGDTLTDATKHNAIELMEMASKVKKG